MEEYAPRGRSILIHLSLAGWLAGCSGMEIRKPDEREDKAIRAGELSVVLLRISGETDGKPAGGLEAYGDGSGGFRLQIASIDAGELPRDVLPAASPSERAARDGWLFLLLEPGPYHLSLIPPGALPDSIRPNRVKMVPQILGRWGYLPGGEFEALPAFVLFVPRGAPILYAGSLSFSVHKADQGVPYRWYGSIQLSEEASRARAVALEEFLGHGDPAIRPLRPYGAPIPDESIHGLAPIGLLTLEPGKIGAPGWSGKVLAAWMMPSAYLATGMVNPEMQMGLHGDPYAYLFLLALAAAYVPIGLTGGLISEQVASSEWASFAADCVQELKHVDPRARMGRGLMRAFGGHLEIPLQLWGEKDFIASAARQRGLRSLLEAGIVRIQIREIPASMDAFCVEASFRARLWDLARDEWVYDSSFLYSNIAQGTQRIPFRRPYEHPIGESSPSRKKSDYCARGGSRIFREEIEKAINLFLERVTQDLGLAPTKPPADIKDPWTSPGIPQGSDS